MGSTIARRIRISRFDDERAPCSAFEAQRRCRNSVQFTPRSTTISIRSAISSPAEFSSRDALPHWPSGAPSRRECRLRVGVLRHAQTTCRYSDKALPSAAQRRPHFLPPLFRRRRAIASRVCLRPIPAKAPFQALNWSRNLLRQQLGIVLSRPGRRRARVCVDWDQDAAMTLLGSCMFRRLSVRRAGGGRHALTICRSGAAPAK